MKVEKVCRGARVNLKRSNNHNLILALPVLLAISRSELTAHFFSPLFNIPLPKLLTSRRCSTLERLSFEELWSSWTSSESGGGSEGVRE